MVAIFKTHTETVPEPTGTEQTISNGSGVIMRWNTANSHEVARAAAQFDRFVALGAIMFAGDVDTTGRPVGAFENTRTFNPEQSVFVQQAYSGG